MRKLLLTVLLLLIVDTALAQRGNKSSQRNIRNSYQALLSQSRTQGAFFDILQFPSQDSTEVLITFRISYEALSFMKLNPNSDVTDLPESAKFYSQLEMSLEVAPRDSTDLPKVQNDEEKSGPIRFFERKKDKEPESFNGKYRAYWKNTATTENFEQTKSSSNYVQGFFRIRLAPGFYAYTIQVKESGRARERSVPPRPLKVMDFTKNDVSSAFFTEADADSANSKILNFGNNTFYGRNFGVLLFGKNLSSASIKIVSERDKNTVFVDSTLDTAIGMRGTLPYLADSSTTKISFRQDSVWNTYLVEIPGAKFKNGTFLLSISRNDSVLFRERFSTLWQDIPLSLLNLETALDMLSFIVPEETVKKFKEGSSEQKEKAFTEFWQKRDPSPETEYNELMAEYYRRIDYAYQKFSTPSEMGFESDQGQTYIKRGPPKEIRREFPVGQLPIEVWVYSDSEVKFQATSGFGDFRRIK